MRQTPQPDTQWTPVQDAKRAFSFLAFASQVLAHPVEVFLRTRFGSQYFGVASLVSFFAVPMWMAFFPQERPTGIMIFWCLYLLMQVRARVESMRLLAKGENGHSRYNGWPRLARVFRWTPESAIKGGIEPLLVFLTAMGITHFSMPLGSYLVAASFALAFNNALIDGLRKARARELNDALIDQQQLAECFRERHGEQ